MTDLITLTDGQTFDITMLPADIQEKLHKYAVIDILKDQAKDQIRAKQINIDKYVKQWLTTKASERTRITYRKALLDFFTYIKKIGIEHPLLIKAEHVDQYIIEFGSRLKNNSIRLKISACSSFYSMLKRYGHITINPFYNSALPKKEYKKAVRPDQNKTIPVMNGKEYKTIVKQLHDNTQAQGKTACIINMRKCALALIPAIHFMATYGLRVGSVPTIEIKQGHFSYTGKGNKSSIQDLMSETLGLLKKYKGNRPFRNYKVTTIQHAFKRVTSRLRDKGLIRFAYSCHDLRHYRSRIYYQQTKDIVSLKNLLGHASINVTDIYLQSIGIK